MEAPGGGLPNILMAIMNRVTKAMILAAGEGTRLRPLTEEVPKVLLPVGGLPLIEHILIWLRHHGISKIAVNLYHLGKKIRGFLGDGSQLEVNICYSAEDSLLGTAGSVKRMEHFFDSTFVVVYGDILTNFDLSKMIQFHRKQGAIATIAIMRVANQEGVGIVKMDEERRIISFVEKPTGDLLMSDLGNGGVYVLESEIFSNIRGEGFSDFACDVFPKLIELGLPFYGYVLNPDDYLIDIGTIEKYHAANNDVQAGKMKIKYG